MKIKMTDLFCDFEGCQVSLRSGVELASLARELARESGWSCYGGLDFCPDHATPAQREALYEVAE